MLADGDVEEGEEEVEDDGEEYVEEDEADASFCDDSSQDEGDFGGDEEDDDGRQTGPGSLVWAKLRSWFPARICDLQEIPSQLKAQLGKQPSAENVVVWLFPPFSEHRVVRLRNIGEEIGENRVDRVFAGRGARINEAYQYALAEKHGDF